MLNESGYTLGDCWAWMFAHNANKMIDAINGDCEGCELIDHGRLWRG